MNEIFVDVLGYEGLYKVSNLGNVLSVKRNKLLKSSKDSYGYLVVALYKNGERKTCKIHRLVATAFLENKLQLPQVNHRDENKENNNVSNLEFCTASYNNTYGTRLERQLANPNYKATREKSLKAIHEKQSKAVLQYTKQREFVAEYPSMSEASKQTKINQGKISMCCNGKRKSCGGFVWRYKDVS